MLSPNSVLAQFLISIQFSALFLFLCVYSWVMSTNYEDNHLQIYTQYWESDPFIYINSRENLPKLYRACVCKQMRVRYTYCILPYHFHLFDSVNCICCCYFEDEFRKTKKWRKVYSAILIIQVCWHLRPSQRRNKRDNKGLKGKRGESKMLLEYLRLSFEQIIITKQ